MIKSVTGLHTEAKFNIRDNTYDAQIIKEVWQDNQYRLGNEIKGVCIDIGGHIGIFSVLASKLGASVYAYEPIKENFDLLKQNIALNKAKVKAYNRAVTMDGRDVNLSKHEKEANTGGFYLSYGGPIPAKSTSIHDIINRFDKIDTLKLDCEGSEYEILYHMQNQEFKKVRRIVLEAHKSFSNALDLLDYLTGKGYGCQLYNIHSQLSIITCTR